MADTYTTEQRMSIDSMIHRMTLRGWITGGRVTATRYEFEVTELGQAKFEILRQLLEELGDHKAPFGSFEEQMFLAWARKHAPGAGRHIPS